MKEIKFRAYIRILKWMVQVERICFDIGTVEVDLTDGNGDTSEYYFEEVELMQYSGLKDKNGVNIYEGDIVCMHNFYGGEDKIDVIGIVRINEMSIYTETKDDELFWLNHWIEPEEELEVLGNIYEHAELLKESKHE